MAEIDDLVKCRCQNIDFHILNRKEKLEIICIHCGLHLTARMSPEFEKKQ